MFDTSQNEVIKHHIVNIFGNICAEMNENLKEAVIKRGHFLTFFHQVADEMSNDASMRGFVIRVMTQFPWIAYNLYC